MRKAFTSATAGTVLTFHNCFQTDVTAGGSDAEEGKKRVAAKSGEGEHSDERGDLRAAKNALCKLANNDEKE